MPGRVVSSPTPTPMLAQSRTPLYDTPTPTPAPTGVGVPLTTPTPTAVFEVEPPMEVVAFMDAPEGPQPTPYVILSAFEPVPGRSSIELRGVIDHLQEFSCPGARCELPVERDSVIAFRAYSSSGGVSQPVNGTIRVVSSDQGYLVSVETTEPVWFFHDSCAEIWGLQGASQQDWMIFPQSPNLLNTKKELHYLATKLILSGVVNASDCPGGGFGAGGVNQCGIERAFPTMVEWQDQYDFNIWLAAREQGIPPKILRTLIEVESQFWPGNSRSYQDEFGLGQISEQGMDAILRWDEDFYKRTCPNVLGDCSRRYMRQPSNLRAMMRGFALMLVNAECATCSYGMDMAKAQKSIQTIAQVLRSDCMDSQSVIKSYNYPATYEDMWKFTLATYHSGLGCVEAGVETSSFVNATKDWQNASYLIPCPGARDYVENFWSILTTFDDNRLAPGENRIGLVAPEYVATRTPALSPTPYVSHARLNVRVYVDTNENGSPDPGEWLDGIQVQVLLENGEELDGQTLNGVAEFDMTGYSVGLRATVLLPALYRTYHLRLPERGDVPIVFAFDQPTFPASFP